MSTKIGLELLREPFPDHQISKKPQGTKAQNDCKPEEKTNCNICGGWHHPRVVHLDYVGHAALTDRLLDADPEWLWEPLAYREGLPAFDSTGGLWIKLTVCGITRLGYGHAAASTYKEIGSREKEVIGDALRNAAMRFGAALDLWHKGELHKDGTEESIKTADEIYSDLTKKYADSIIAVKDGIRDNQLGLAAEAWYELSEEIQIGLWKAPTKNGCFTVDERKTMKSPEFREAYYVATAS